MPNKIFKLGTRGSSLALAQANLVADRLAQSAKVRVEIVIIQTTGDQRVGEERAATWDKQDWVKEIEIALLNGEIDFAVHSAKDVPYQIQAGTVLTSVLERESAADICIFKNSLHRSLADLAAGAKIGTSSVRRAAQISVYRKDLKVVPVRGNVPTRIRKLKESTDLDAIVLAQAGINRLGLSIESFAVLDETLMMPAVNQGVLAAQYLEQNTEVRTLLSHLLDPKTEVIFNAERAFIRTIEANCNSAVSVLCKHVEDDQFILASRIYSVDYSIIIEGSIELRSGEASLKGQELGEKLLNQGAKSLLN